MITIKDFRENNFEKRGHSRDKHPVLLFLRRDRFHAHTVKEISKAVKMSGNTVRSMLYVLMKDKLVEHKAPYFAIIQKVNKNSSKKTGKKLKKRK